MKFVLELIVKSITQSN